MGRGDNEAFKKNMGRMKDLTTDEQRKIQRKGGEASARQRHLMRELQDTLSSCITEDEKVQAVRKLLEEMLAGNMQAFKVFIDIAKFGEPENINLNGFENLFSSMTNEQAEAVLRKYVEKG